MSLHQKCSLANTCPYASETVPGTCGYHHCRAFDDNKNKNHHNSYTYGLPSHSQSCSTCANRSSCSSRYSGGCGNYTYDM